jgi:hypothetical protein
MERLKETYQIGFLLIEKFICGYLELTESVSNHKEREGLE